METDGDWLKSDELNRWIRFWPFFFLLTSIEGVVAFSRLLAIPADPKNVVWFGFSASRLILAAVIVLLTLISTVLAYLSWRKPDWRQRWLHPGSNPALFAVGIPVAGLLVLFCWFILFKPLEYAEGAFFHWVLLNSPRPFPEGYFIPYYIRLQPLVEWILLGGVQGFLWLAAIRFGLHWKNVRWSGAMPAAAIVFLIFLMGVALVALTGLGITDDLIPYGQPGVPLLEWQMWLAAGLAFILLGIGLRWRLPARKDPRRRRALWVDWLLILILWASAAALWLDQPILNSYFAPAARPPNFEIYPYSDAAFYDITAQSILLGEGFMDGQVVTRPLYILYQAGLRAAAGQDYAGVILLQTLILAFLPVVLYLIGRALHSRTAGLLAGSLAILREVNSIQATPFAQVSHSKLFLSDLPAALGVALFTFLLITWLKKPLAGKDAPGGLGVMPLVAGGAFGLLMLVRAQVVVLLPFLLLLMLLVFRWQWRAWLRASLMIAAGLLLGILPWLWRNWQVSGQVIFDQPAQMQMIVQRYSLSPSTRLEPIQGVESVSASSSGLQSVLQFMLAHPQAVINFIAAHFMRNEIGTLFVMPLRTEMVKNFEDLLGITSPFWLDWAQGFGAAKILLILLYLLLIALGAGAAWQKGRWIGLLPLWVNLAYCLSNGLARNSGWRFILPVDWVGYFYLCIGLAQVAAWVLMLFGARAGRIEEISGFEPPAAVSHILPVIPLRKALLAGLCILLIGGVLPAVEQIIPRQLLDPSEAEIENMLFDANMLRRAGLDLSEVKALAGQEGVLIRYGRIFYPRFYPPEEGEPGSGWPAYEPRSQYRLGFLLLHRGRVHVIFNTERSPDFFPNNSDAIVLGCWDGDHLNAWLVTVLTNPGYTYYQPEDMRAVCQNTGMK